MLCRLCRINWNYSNEMNWSCVQSVQHNWNELNSIDILQFSSVQVHSFCRCRHALSVSHHDCNDLQIQVSEVKKIPAKLSDFLLTPVQQLCLFFQWHNLNTWKYSENISYHISNAQHQICLPHFPHTCFSYVLVAKLFAERCLAATADIMAYFHLTAYFSSLTLD